MLFARRYWDRSFVRLLAACAVLQVAQGAWAQVGAPITVDEAGNGLPSVVAPDPVSGTPTVTFSLPLAVTPGDVLLFNPDDVPAGGGQPQPQSDLVRFVAADPAIGGGPAMLFFSETGDGTSEVDPADVGLPPFAGAVIVPETGPDGANGAFYTPAAGAPGSLPTGAPITYHFISDGRVPEPASGLLLLIAAGLLAVARRWRRAAG